MIGQRKSVQFDVGGVFISQGLKCDKLILVEGATHSEDCSWVEIFVELKGKNVPHAVDQLRATLQNPLFKHPSNTVVRAAIVAASFPRNKI